MPAAPHDKIKVVHSWPEHTVMHAQSILSGQTLFLSLEEGGHLEIPKGLENDQRAILWSLYFLLKTLSQPHWHSAVLMSKVMEAATA